MVGGLLLVGAVVDGLNGVGGGVLAYVVVRLRLFGLLFGENDVWAAEEKKEVATEVNLHGLQAAILRRTGGLRQYVTRQRDCRAIDLSERINITPVLI